MIVETNHMNTNKDKKERDPLPLGGGSGDKSEFMFSELVDQGILGDAIRRLRTAKGWTQSNLALHCGIQNSFISRLEKGDRAASTPTMIKIARALGVSPYALIVYSMHDDESLGPPLRAKLSALREDAQSDLFGTDR